MIYGRNEALNAIVKGKPIPRPGTPESFKVLMRELQSLGLDIGVYTDEGKEVDLMQDINPRILLRANLYLSGPRNIGRLNTLLSLSNQFS